MEAGAAPPSTDRGRTACVALSATGAAVVIGVLLSLAVGPGVAAEAGGAGKGGGGSGLVGRGVVAERGASLPPPPPPRVTGLSSSNSWFDCPPGLAASDAAADNSRVSFFVLGDWGRQGNANQRRASDALADVAACASPSYVVSVGDNFYPEGLFSPDDEQFQSSFARVYGPEGGGDPRGRARLAALPFYAALGNHDAVEGRQGALRLHGRYSLTPALLASEKNGAAAAAGRWHCYNGTWAVPDASRGAVEGGAGRGRGMGSTPPQLNASLTAGAPVAFGLAPKPPPVVGGGGAAASASSPGAPRPLLDLIIIDTNPFLNYDAWASGEREAAAAAVREGLERRLRASRALWRVVVGHHPVRSLGEHCDGDPEAADCAQMAWLAPVLREHGVAAYLAGHEHDLQLLFEKDGGGGEARWPAYVVSGAGSNIRLNEFASAGDGKEKPLRPLAPGYSAPFVAGQQGFVAAVVNETALALHYYTLGHRLPAHTTVLRRR
jgi:hypothetical protein